MDNNRLAKRIAFSDTLQGKRKRGRPPFSWRQAINQDLKVFQLQYITSLDENSQQQTLKTRSEKSFLLDDINWRTFKKEKDRGKKTYTDMTWILYICFLQGVVI